MRAGKRTCGIQRESCSHSPGIARSATASIGHHWQTGGITRLVALAVRWMTPPNSRWMDADVI
jgi:hypothetical protein